MLTAAGIGVAILVAASAAHSWWQRRTRLVRLRAEWGHPVSRVREMAAIASYFRSRARSADSDAYLDDRTWADLNLDDLFERLDRTGIGGCESGAVKAVRDSRCPEVDAPGLLPAACHHGNAVDAEGLQLVTGV